MHSRPYPTGEALRRNGCYDPKHSDSTNAVSSGVTVVHKPTIDKILRTQLQHTSRLVHTGSVNTKPISDKYPFEE